MGYAFDSMGEFKTVITTYAQGHNQMEAGGASNPYSGGLTPQIEWWKN